MSSNKFLNLQPLILIICLKLVFRTKLTASQWMVKNEINAEYFFMCLNYKQPNIKVTAAKKTNTFLPFRTLVHRKKISIELFKQYNSFTHSNYAIGLIKCLIDRAIKFSSSQVIFYNEINKIKNILQQNMYHIFVIDNQIKTFLKIQYTIKCYDNTIINNERF